MGTLNLGQVYSLTSDEINENVEEKMGNYALGFYKKDEDDKLAFYPKYVGSSYTDLKAEIIQQGMNLKVKSNGSPKFTHFKFSHDANTAIKAFKKESENYHAFEKQLENERHPKRPEGYNSDNLKCPVEGCER